MRVGLTGGIASGKSTVSRTLSELGAVVIDADAIVREVQAKGSPGLEAIVDAFGPEILSPEGDLDRPRLGNIVFADPGKLTVLNAIVHPLVRARSQELEEGAPEGALVVHDIPLLAESGMAETFDAVIVVDVPEELQVERMIRDRGMTESDARARIALQATRDQRNAIATHLIENTGSLEDLRHQVTEVFERLTH